MIEKRARLDRGHADHGWLDTWHTFSFDTYYDPAHKHFRHLRVINEDVVAPAQGFPTHPHRDMEIITYILSGALEHKDSMGTGSVIARGDVQRMSAGTGITHSEYNASAKDPVHLLQIWLFPDEKGLKPSYEQKGFHPDELRNRLRLIASRNGLDGSIGIHQDVGLYAALLENGQTVHHSIGAGRYAWIQVASGTLQLNGISLEAGDGAAVSDEQELELEATGDSEILLFDLA